MEQESRVRGCIRKPKSARVLLRDHTINRLLPPILCAKNSRACAGAALCDGNQDKWYKQWGMCGSLKASVLSKSYKETEMETGLSEFNDDVQPREMQIL